MSCYEIYLFNVIFIDSCNYHPYKLQCLQETFDVDRRTVDGQIKLGQNDNHINSKFTNFHRLMTALSQIG
jgi:predicted regulator of amino acid metabolism with ACT domain